MHVFVNVSLIPWETLARHLVNQSAETDTDVERKRRSAATGWAISWAASDAGIVNASRTSVVETGAVETRYAVYEDAQTWLRVATSSVDLPATVAELRRVAGLNASTLWDVTRIPLLINVKVAVTKYICIHCPTEVRNRTKRKEKRLTNDDLEPLLKIPI